MEIGIKKVFEGLKELGEERSNSGLRDQSHFTNIQSSLGKTIDMVKSFTNQYYSNINFDEKKLEEEENAQIPDEENTYDLDTAPASTQFNAIENEQGQSSNQTNELVTSKITMPVHQLIPTSSTSSYNKVLSNNKSDDDYLRHPERYSNDQRGFLHLKQYLASLDYKIPELVPSLSIRNLKDTNGKETQLMSKVIFQYKNNPMPGWTKDVKLRMTGKTKGRFDIVYTSSDYDRRLSTKGEVMQYLEQERLPVSAGERFDFRAVFCVCQTSEDPCRNFIECSYGLCGCNAWIHPECVGLGARSEEDLQKMKKAICPFCSYYLEGSGQLDQYSKQALILREITVGTIVTDSVLDDFDIEESNLPHRIWGLEGSHCSFEQKGKTFKPVFPHRDGVLDILLDPHRRSSVGNSNVVISYNNSKTNEVNRAPAKRGRKRLYEPSGMWQHALLKGTAKTTATTAQSDSESDHGMEEDEDNLIPLREKRRSITYDGRKVQLGVKGGFVGMEKDRPHLMSDEELMRARIVEKIKALQGLEHTPSNLMEKDLLQIMLTSSKAVNKQKKRPIGRPSHIIEYSQKDINAMMAFIPLDDGGVRMTTIATNLQPKSLHNLCLRKCCGFCFRPFTAEDSDCTTEVILGAMEYRLHDNCFLMFQHNKFIAEDSSVLSIEGVHMSPSVDDVDCDLCGRTGGVLVEFLIDKKVTAASPSNRTYWVGHVPCLQYLASSKLFAAPIDSPESFETERAKARLAKLSASTNDEVEEQDGEAPPQPVLANPPEPLSLFDVLLQANRCALCGGEGGIAPRCIAVNCCSRVHPLCCSLAEGWLVADFTLHRHAKVRGIICPAHNPTKK